MSIAALLEAAKDLPGKGRPNYAQYTPVVRLLRKKGYSYQRIFDWLIENGEALEERNFSAFRASVSMRVARLERQAGKEAA